MRISIKYEWESNGEQERYYTNMSDILPSEVKHMMNHSAKVFLRHKEWVDGGRKNPIRTRPKEFSYEDLSREIEKHG